MYRSVVIPLGNLKYGAARHRALLFKLLADSLNIRCQLRRGDPAGADEDMAVNAVMLDGKVCVCVMHGCLT